MSLPSKPRFFPKRSLHAVDTLQADQKKWVAYNFPNEQKHSPLLGALEELGELAHAHLKNEQNIRGTTAEHRAAAQDAIGDVLIYLLSYCNQNGYRLSQCWLDAWNEVKDRDWRRWPDTGKPPVGSIFPGQIGAAEATHAAHQVGTDADGCNGLETYVRRDQYDATLRRIQDQIVEERNDHKAETTILRAEITRERSGKVEALRKMTAAIDALEGPIEDDDEEC